MFNLKKLVSFSIINVSVLENPISDDDRNNIIDVCDFDNEEKQNYPVGKILSEKERFQLLQDVCDNVHSSCYNDCPVYELNGQSAPNKTNSRFRCDCFKNGEKMYNFILNKIEIKNI